MFFTLNRNLLVTLSTCVCLNTSTAQTSITGLADRGVYQDSVTFTVAPEAGYDLKALLDGQALDFSAPIVVADVDYHELLLQATNAASGQFTNQLFRFNVLASERRGSENGLPSWIPLPSIPSTSQETEGGRLRVLCPSAYPTNIEIPVAAWVETASGMPLRVNGFLHGPEGAKVLLRRGSGGGFLHAVSEPGAQPYSLALNQLTSQKTVLIESNISWVSVSGTLEGSREWTANSRILIEADVFLPSDAELRIGASSIVRLAPGVRVFVAGQCVIAGAEDMPVTFLPAVKNQPWGGFYLTNSSSRLEATSSIFTGSGANPNAVPQSHRHEECLFYLDNHAELRLTNCAAMFLTGQFGHGVDRGQPWNSVTIVDSLIQGCTTGGEWNGSSIFLLRSSLIEMPFERTAFNDGDEDGIYFTTGEYRVQDTLVGWAGDDGIDAGSGGGSSVVVSHTWIESIYHEAFAWSGGNRRSTNLNCVAINCGQGIECGWSSTSDSPFVFSENCLLTANAVGARFGDNYDWTYNGVLFVTNSILIHNLRDVWGLNWDDWTYRTNQMEIVGNLVTSPSQLHPNNTVWEPKEHASRLLEFMSIPPGAEVGIGLALFSTQFPFSRLYDPIPVRLSHFSTNTVIIQYTLAAADGILAGGELRFEPGETVKHVPPVNVPINHALIRLTLHDPEHAQITGIADAWFARPTISAEVLVPAGSKWKYRDTGEDLGIAWRELLYDDNQWASGPAELGYGDARDGRPEATTINSGSDTGARHITYYFRHAFQVQDTTKIEALRVSLKRDDGAIVYLNGQEVFRSNLPDGPVNYLTTSSLASDDGSIFYSTNAPPSLLLNDTNLLAVEVHQESSGSSDVSFDLQLEALPALRLDALAFDDEWFIVWDQASADLLQSDSPLAGWVLLSTNSPYKLPLETGTSFFRLQKR